MNCSNSFIRSTLIVTSFLVWLPLTGCASRGVMSANQIGCAPQETTVSDADRGLNTVTWTAACRGKEYYCWRSSFEGTQCKEKPASN